MKKPKFTTHTLETGETINFQIRSLFGLVFLNIHVNFNPMQHVLFASAFILSIPGIGRVTSVEIGKDDTSGTFFFSLQKDFDHEVINTGIETEFKSYFNNLKMQQLCQHSKLD